MGINGHNKICFPEDYLCHLTWLRQCCTVELEAAITKGNDRFGSHRPKISVASEHV